MNRFEIVHSDSDEVVETGTGSMADAQRRLDVWLRRTHTPHHLRLAVVDLTDSTLLLKGVS